MNTTVSSFDPVLMERYNQNGPRYTSYPTATQFREGVELKDYYLASRYSPGALARDPLALYVHIPFCFSPCFYCGCNKVVTRHLTQVDAYVRLLLEEVTLRGRYFDKGRIIEQMHFGGGTPTFLPKKLFVAIIDKLDREFTLTEGDERDYSIEIDPRGVDEGTLHLLAGFGFNRLSLGVQDFDERVQRAINRVQPAALVVNVYDAARASGFRSINFDLIYGLPCQTEATFEATLDRVVGMRPDRLAVYGYAHMPQLFPAQRQFRKHELPDSALRLRLLQLAIGKLTAAGYVYIGMDHFALPSDSLARSHREGTLHRSFQGYTTHAERDLVALGVSAIGQVGNLYVQNHKSLDEYQESMERGSLPQQRGVIMSADDVVRAKVIQQIMCHGHVDVAGIEAQEGIRFKDYFAAESHKLAALEADGLVRVTDTSILLTAAGRLLMRTVAMVFDAYLRAPSKAVPMSRLM